jgi:hypothetical protein
MMRALKQKWHDYKLRHLRLGKVKMLDKKDNHSFKIVDIDRDVHWKINVYLTVIIRDYLRFFINNTPAIGNCVIDDHDAVKYGMTDEQSDYYAKKWQDLVNSVADEFDELLKLDMEIDKANDISEAHKRWEALKNKAFSDLAFIYEDLSW